MDIIRKKIMKMLSSMAVMALALTGAITVEAAQDLVTELVDANTGDTVTLSEDYGIGSIQIPEGVTLVIPEGITLSVWSGFVNNGSVVINGTLELPGEDYDEDTDELTPAYNIDDLTNSTGTGKVIIDGLEYTYIEATGKFGCTHATHTEGGDCSNCGTYIGHYADGSICSCGKVAEASIVCDGVTSYYDHMREAMWVSNELLSENSDAVINIYADGYATFWEENYLKCNLVLNGEIYMPSAGFLEICEGAVMTITENGLLSNAVYNITNKGTIIIPEGASIPDISGVSGSCVIVGDVRYAYTEDGTYEICDHTSYTGGKCSGCSLKCEHDSFTIGTTVDCDVCDISLVLDIEVSECIYTGEKLNPTIKVVAGDVTLVEGTDYTVAWPADMVNIGDKTVTVTGTGKYSGIATEDFTITEESDITPPDTEDESNTTQPDAEDESNTTQPDTEDESNITPPDTGDGSNALVIMALMMVSGAMAMAVSGKKVTLSKSN